MNRSDVNHRFPGQKLLIGLAALFVVGAGLKAGQSFFVPILFAWFLAVLGAPSAKYLIEKGVPKVIAVLLVAFILIFGLTGIVFLFYTSLSDFRSALPGYQLKLQSLISEIEKLITGFGVEFTTNDIFGNIDARAAFELVSTTLKGVLGALTIAIVVLVMMIFMLYEATDFKKKLKLAMGAAFQQDKFDGVAIDMQRYLGIKTVTSFITGVLVGLLNYIVGVDFWLLWGLMAFLFNFIPFIGSIVASIPAIILAFILFGTPAGIIMIVGYLAINNLVSSALEPVLMGPRLGLSPLVVFISIGLWGWLWGPGGMFLSVPLTMVIKIILDHSEEFRWVALLMEGEVKEDKPSAATA